MTAKQDAQREWDRLRATATVMERIKPGTGEELFRLAAASLKAVREGSIQVSAGSAGGSFRR